MNNRIKSAIEYWPEVLLSLALVALKVCSVITASWWLVTLPLWLGPVAIPAALGAMLGVLAYHFGGMTFEAHSTEDCPTD